MGERSEQVQPNDGFSRVRIYSLMAIAILAAAAVGTAFQGLRFGVGVILGGLLAYGNFLWLDRSTKAIFERAADGVSVGTPAIGYILRYAVIGGVLLLIFMTNALPIVAVLLGLGTFALAVVADGIYRIFFERV